MYTTDVQKMVETAGTKVAYLEGAPVGYIILAALAGVYLGFGITLIFSMRTRAARNDTSVSPIMGPKARNICRDFTSELARDTSSPVCVRS